MATQARDGSDEKPAPTAPAQPVAVPEQSLSPVVPPATSLAVEVPQEDAGPTLEKRKAPPPARKDEGLLAVSEEKEASSTDEAVHSAAGRSDVAEKPAGVVSAIESKPEVESVTGPSSEIGADGQSLSSPRPQGPQDRPMPAHGPSATAAPRAASEQPERRIVAQRQSVARPPFEPPPWVDEDIPDEDAISNEPVPLEDLDIEAALEADEAPVPLQPPSVPPISVGRASAESSREPLPELPPPTPLTDRWSELVDQLVADERIKALARQLALNTEARRIEEGEGGFSLACERETLMQENTRKKLEVALQDLLGHPVVLDVQHGPVRDTPGRRHALQDARRQAEAEAKVANDPDVRAWLQQFPGAVIIPGSVHPL